MSLKNLMVHLDAGERCTARLALATELARSHGARLTGVFAQRGTAQRVGVVASWPSPEYAAARDASKVAFEKATAGLPNTEWIDVNRGSDAEVLAGVTRIARHFDLVILGQRYAEGNTLLPDEFANDVIVDCGRPVLVLPYAGNYATIGKRPMIAWNEAREAARALNDALPLLGGVDECWVMSFAARQEDAEACCTGVLRHLADHGVKAKSEVLVVQDFGIMDLLLNRVSDRSADLLVMGAHGHIGFPFINRGAGTRYILQHMTVPVLMSS